MIRYVFCIKRRQGLSADELRHYWRDPGFDSLIGRLVELLAPLRHAKSLVLDVEANAEIMRERGTGEPFDGIIEYWWENASRLLEVADSPEATDLLKQMHDYQSQFVDFARSSIFFTEA